MALKAVLLLADSAQAVGGKLYVLGGGWSNCWGAIPFAIAAKIEVPWDQATRTHTWRLELVDSDGNSVELPQDDGSANPVEIEGTFSTGIAPGVKQGTPMDAVLAINFGPMPLETGRYVWQFSIDGETDEDWCLAFNRVDPPNPNAIAI